MTSLMYPVQSLCVCSVPQNASRLFHGKFNPKIITSTYAGCYIRSTLRRKNETEKSDVKYGLLNKRIIIFHALCA
jgi:hypothetical protein